MNVRIIIATIIIAAQLTSCSKDNPEPSIEKTNQDRQVGILSSNAAFTDMFNKLTDESKKIDFEAGYFIYPSQSQTFRYVRIEGRPGEPFISFLPEGQIAGVVHCHYNNLFPSFSGSDIKAIYELYVDEYMNDYYSFFCGVVSYTGRGYLLLIEDLNKFLAFSAKNFKERERFRNFELAYFNKQQAYKDSGFESSYEIALSELLSGSGLRLYKSNMPYGQWVKLSFENGALREYKLNK
ncbi:hypothetical protein [Sphingobacterium detergens]|uniref:Uncharacterized protein n=1 Tax=Sphingobacterium detergens TaxID=1145106 RepID=A0A420B773_SPHD1|nr:hypothetical protein [Sphingobacterium detergens]RKE52465.1 hypothetical protein DFQ12_2702 [Sphingobacterium detergens]